MKIKTAFLVSSSLIVIILTLTSLNLLVADDDLIENKVEFYKSYDVVNPTPIEMYEHLEKYSDEYEIPRYIIYNIAYKETRYRGPFDWKYIPSRKSSAGALGPMQVMPSTAKLICGKNVPSKKLTNDMELNVEISAKLLRRLYDKYQDWEIVCGCYNTGKPIVNEYAVFCSNNKDYQQNWVQP